MDVAIFELLFLEAWTMRFYKWMEIANHVESACKYACTLLDKMNFVIAFYAASVRL